MSSLPRGAVMSRRTGGLAGATRFFWLRHGPIPDGKGRISGRRDLACDLSDRDTVSALAAALPKGAVLLSSPLCRAVDTARAVTGREPDRLVPELMEQDFGRWTGRRWDELAEEARGIGFWDDPAAVAPPDGESFRDQCRRVEAAILSVAAEWPGREVVCACHAGTVRAAVAVALGVVEAPAPALALVIDPLSLTRIDALADGRAAILGVNRVFGSDR